MRRCNRILIVYDFYGVSLQQLKDAFKHVAKHQVPQRYFPYYSECFWVDEDSDKLRHIQVQYDGRPFIVARDKFEEANRTVHRFLKSSGKVKHEISRNSTNQFD